MVFVILYVDDILLIENDVGKLPSDRKNKMIALSQASYIDKVLEHITMTDAKPDTQLIALGFYLSLDDCPETAEEREHMSKAPYASVVGSLMHAILCTCPNIFSAVEMFGENLTPIGYTDSNFQTCKDSWKSTLGNVFVLGYRAIVWRSVKKSCTVDSTMEVEYVATSEEMKEAIWLRKFLINFKVIPVAEGIVDVVKVASKDNLADLFTKTLVTNSFNEHVEDMRT
ncbi:gag/pol protein [Gossypium australe]|uniref:Gag/pol protein n=1 Tax=Gossypium australe TaxID=47621 RepID=A0A5B6X3J8_9ROSI|nr:gag/pol protein [Gossypium australe]